MVSFVYTNATQQLAEQVDAIQALDTKIGVILAAILVGASFAFTSSQPTWLRWIIAILLALALLLALIAFVAPRRSDVLGGLRWAAAPDPRAVSEFQGLDVEDLEEFFLPNVLGAFSANEQVYILKFHLFSACLGTIALGALVIGGSRLAGHV